MAVKDVIVHKVQKIYWHEVESSFRYIEEYDMEGERPTRTMILDTYYNTTETDKTGLDMLYQAYTNDYIKRSIELNQNLRK